MNKKLLLVSAALLAATGTAWAQKRVTGQVVDSEGKPIAGATVHVKGANLKTATDANGRFALANVPASAKHLDVSYLGMTTATVTIAGEMKVVLKDNEQQLGEAYVVAYGRATKAAFTGAATKIQADKIDAKATTEVTQALQGEVAGVQIVNNDGNPGANASIYIRGIGSLKSDTQPLVVLDGIPYGGDFSSIDPKDIASIDVMKDATAAALYGSRGANGVVIVTTKRGVKGKMSVGADVKYSVSGRWLPTYETISSPERYTELCWEGMRNGFMVDYGYGAEDAAATASYYLFSPYGLPTMYNMWNAEGSELIDPETGLFVPGITRRYSPENWQDALFRTGQRVDGNIHFTGGTDRTKSYTSLGYTQDKGYLVGADFKRFSVRSNIETKVTDWLKATANLSYANVESNKPVQDKYAANNALTFSNLCPSIFPVYLHDDEGNRIKDELVGGWAYDYGDTPGQGRPYSSGINAAGAANLDKDKTRADQFVGNGGLEATFLRDFKLAANLGYTYYNSVQSVLSNPYYGDGMNANGRLDRYDYTLRTITGNQILSWAHTFGQKHNLSAFAGHEAYWEDADYTYIYKYNLVRSNDLSLGNAVCQQGAGGYDYGYALESWFGQIAYDFDNKYFFNASFRADGSSRFAKGHRWGNFGSVSAAWNLTNEEFMKQQQLLHNLKLKASWGLVGNQGLLDTSLEGSAAFFPYEDQYEINNMGGKPSFSLVQKGNEDLTWEKTSNLNVGVEFDVAGIVEGEVDYFNKLTYDMLFMKSVSPSLGYVAKPVNDGKMRNSGVEFNLTVHAVKRPDWQLDLRLNGSHYRNRMVKMPVDAVTGQEQYYYKNGSYLWQKGHSIYDFYLREYAGVDPETGTALYNKYIATFADGTQQAIADMELFKSQHLGESYTVSHETTTNANQATYKYSGKSALPDLTGGFGFDLRIKDFTLSATFTYSLGGSGYDYTYQLLMSDYPLGYYNWHRDMEKRWQKPGDVTDIPKLSNYSSEGYYANATSDRWLINRNYLCLSNVSASYNLPASITRGLMGLTQLQLYVSGENLFYLSARKGFFPGTSLTGVSSAEQYLPSSSFTVGLKVQF
ncbi:MAG: SusC/RagA family TonB-linked outer membrane protein [Alloprevotella sp.]